METLLQDARFALRSLAKAPLFTTLAVLCLAVGIGVNANVYSAVYAAFLRPFGFADAERLVVLEDRQQARGQVDWAFSYATFRDIREQNTAFDAVAGSAYRSLTITDGVEPVRLQGGLVTANLFPLLGVAPHIGRVFSADEDRPGAPPAILLGYGVWERRYAADSSIIGRSIPVNGSPHVVIGVMPPNFMFPFRNEAWVALVPLLHASAASSREIQTYARLKPEMDVDRASTQLASISARIESQRPESQQGWRAYARPMREVFVPADTKLAIGAMMGAVTFVLLIACANVANLLLARATNRSREIAVRSALGAGRGRIVRQLLTESVILAMIACPIGIGIAFWLLDLVLARIPEGDMPYYIVFAIDGPVLLYAVLIAAITGIVFGLVPALHAARGDLQGALRDGSRGAGAGMRRNRLQAALVVGEIALSMMLLVGAALFIRSFLNVQNKTGGIDPANMLTLRFFMPGQQYDTPRAVQGRVLDIIERVEALPGVVSATASNQIPLSGGGSGSQIEVEGKPPAAAADAPFALWTGVTRGWFATLGVPLRAGRNLTDAEARDSSRVAVINETMARRFWPGGDPIGRRFRMLRDTSWFTVIGVAADFHSTELDDNDPVRAHFYVSYMYLPIRNTGLMVRTEREPAQLASAVRGVIRDSDPQIPVFELMTMEELRRFGFWSQRLFGWMFSMFGAVALVLAAVGIYGVIAYGVSQRTQEIGVRVALGAQPRDVIRLVLRQGAILVVAGVLIGLPAAIGVARVIQSLLIDVAPTDVTSFAAVSVFLAAVALLASYVPALRATRVDPLTALRAE